MLCVCECVAYVGTWCHELEQQLVCGYMVSRTWAAAMRSPSSFLCVRCRSHVTVCDTHSEVTHTLIYVKCMSRVTHLCEVHESCYLCKVQELCYCVCVCVCVCVSGASGCIVLRTWAAVYMHIFTYIYVHMSFCVCGWEVHVGASVFVWLCVSHTATWLLHSFVKTRNLRGRSAWVPQTHEVRNTM